MGRGVERGLGQGKGLGQWEDGKMGLSKARKAQLLLFGSVLGSKSRSPGQPVSGIWQLAPPRMHDSKLKFKTNLTKLKERSSIHAHTLSHTRRRVYTHADKQTASKHSGNTRMTDGLLVCRSVQSAIQSLSQSVSHSIIPSLQRPQCTLYAAAAMTTTSKATTPKRRQQQTQPKSSLNLAQCEFGCRRLGTNRPTDRPTDQLNISGLDKEGQHQQQQQQE